MEITPTSRARVRGTVLCGAALTSVVAVVGCADSEVKTEAEKAPVAVKAPKPKPKPAGVGDSHVLTDVEGNHFRVTLNSVTDPVQGGEYDTPQGGHRFAGVQIRIENLSKAAYDDSPSNGAALSLADDTQANTTILMEGPFANSSASGAKIAPGNALVTNIPFEVPIGKRLARFQFTLDSGFAGSTGEWVIKKVKPAAPVQAAGPSQAEIEADQAAAQLEAEQAEAERQAEADQAEQERQAAADEAKLAEEQRKADEELKRQQAQWADEERQAEAEAQAEAERQAEEDRRYEAEMAEQERQWQAEQDEFDRQLRQSGYTG